MSHSIFATLLASFGAAATNLTHVQARAEAHRAASLDPRDLPEHLRRDIGLADGHSFGAEVPGARDLTGGATSRWTDHVQTRQAA